MNIGENIKKYRKENNMTQKQLASLINKNIRTVQKYENGEIDPPLDVLIDISQVLKVTVNELTGEKQLTSSQQFLNDVIKDYNETLESLSEKSGVPLNELEALYNNTDGCTEKTYKKLYNYLGLSNEEALLFFLCDKQIKYFIHNGIYENFFNDLFLDKVNLKEFGLNLNSHKDSNQNNNQVKNIKKLDINSILSSELYFCDYKESASIYEVEDIYKNEINQLKQLNQMKIDNLNECIENMKIHIKDTEIVKDELYKMLDEKNLIIQNLKEIISNLKKDNKLLKNDDNSQT